MLYFCVGIARSGKSTYCSNWVRETPGRVIVCADDIRLALHGQAFIAEAEPTVEAMKLVMIKAHLRRGMNVIVDGTHTTSHSIRKMLELDKNAQPIIFTTSPEECKKRAIASKQSYLVDKGVIDRMGTQLADLVEYGRQLDFGLNIRRTDEQYIKNAIEAIRKQ